MEIYLSSVSGWLSKRSGQDWADCLLQPPQAWPAQTGTSLRVGKRWYVDKQVQNWEISRPLLSFPTSLIGEVRPIKSAFLELPVVGYGAQWLGGALKVYRSDELWSQFGLDAGDWFWGENYDLLPTTGNPAVLRYRVDPDYIRRSGLTEFKLQYNNEEPDDPYPDDISILIKGADAGKQGAKLVIDTGNIADDAAVNATQVLQAKKDSLVAAGRTDDPLAKVEAIRSELHHDVMKAREIQVGWARTNEAKKPSPQIRVTLEIFYIHQEAAGAAASRITLDGEVRRAVDCIRRALMEDDNCQGYFTELESSDSELADALIWANGKIYKGAVIRPVYVRQTGRGAKY